MEGRVELAPDKMTDAQLWKLVDGRLMALRIAIDTGEGRWTLHSRIVVIESAVDELRHRGTQGSFDLFAAGFAIGVDAPRVDGP